MNKQTTKEGWEKSETETVKRFVLGMLAQYGRRWEELTELQQATFNDDLDKLVNGIIRQLLAKQREEMIDDFLLIIDKAAKESFPFWGRQREVVSLQDKVKKLKTHTTKEEK